MNDPFMNVLTDFMYIFAYVLILAPELSIFSSLITSPSVFFSIVNLLKFYFFISNSLFYL